MKLHGEGARLRRLWRPLVVNKYLKSTPVTLLHIGCGWNHVDGWLNVDKFAANADTYLNAYSRFPFPSESFDKVFSEHMIEHLEVDRLRKNCRKNILTWHTVVTTIMRNGWPMCRTALGDTAL